MLRLYSYNKKRNFRSKNTLIITRAILQARYLEQRAQACTPTLLFPVLITGECNG